jgi:hypothetical protein
MEEFSMARQSKREYLRSIYKRYREGRRTEKTAMEEFCKVCGYNRKYAIGLLSRPLSKAAARRRVTVRSASYSKASISTLAKVWEASGYLCSQRLKAALPQWLPWIKKHFEVNGEMEKELLGISARQMDRRLSPHKRTVKRRLYGTTRPGSLLKQMIPIKTDHWNVTLPRQSRNRSSLAFGFLSRRGVHLYAGLRRHRHRLGGTTSGHGQRSARHRRRPWGNRTKVALSLARHRL